MTTTDFSLKLLGKSLTQITAEDLIEYFQINREESDILEFKSFYRYSGNTKDFQKREDVILKTICAFLNSSGGLLIWGAPAEEKANDNQKSFKGELTLVEKHIEKDAFVSKVSNRIIPVPPKVNFHPVEIEEGKFVYLIEIQESITKPHQFDNRYFMRLDGQTKAAPHHYIEALFKQIKYPDLVGCVEFHKCSIDKNNLLVPVTVNIGNCTPFQNEENVTFLLSTTEGKFRDESSTNDVFKNLRFEDNSTQIINRKFIEVLHYGLQEKFTVYILLDTREIENHTLKVDLNLSFGGKFSPLKISRYRLYINLDSESKIDFYTAPLQENVLAYDYWKNKQILPISQKNRNLNQNTTL